MLGRFAVGGGVVLGVGIGVALLAVFHCVARLKLVDAAFFWICERPQYCPFLVLFWVDREGAKEGILV